MDWTSGRGDGEVGGRRKGNEERSLSQNDGPPTPPCKKRVTARRRYANLPVLSEMIGVEDFEEKGTKSA